MKPQYNRISSFMAIGRRYTLDIKVFLDEDDVSPVVYMLQIDVSTMSEFLDEYEKLIPAFAPKLAAVGVIVNPFHNREYCEYDDEYFCNIARLARNCCDRVE